VGGRKEGRREGGKEKEAIGERGLGKVAQLATNLAVGENSEDLVVVDGLR
jgi:hypothetical protein